MMATQPPTAGNTGGATQPPSGGGTTPSSGTGSSTEDGTAATTGGTPSLLFQGALSLTLLLVILAAVLMG